LELSCPLNIATFYREGSEPGLGAVATGSHVDAIPFSGKFDGVVGVLGALEAISLLKRLQFCLPISVFTIPAAPRMILCIAFFYCCSVVHM